MRKLDSSIRTFGLVLAFSILLPTRFVAAGDDPGDESERGLIPSFTATVNCAQGHTITRAVNRFPIVRKLKIRFRGACQERVVIERDDVSIEGIGPDAEIVGGITVDGAVRVSLADFAIKGDPTDPVGIGLQAVRGAAISASRLTLEGLSRGGVTIESSVGELSDIMAQGNGGGGIVFQRATGSLGGTITANANNIGLFVTLGSSVQIPSGELRFEQNAVAVAVQVNSSVEHASGRLVVTGSFFGLLLAGQGSYAHADEILAENNVFFGVFADELSNLTPLIGAPGSGPRITSRNNDIGVLVDRLSQVQLAAGTVVESNRIGMQVSNSEVMTAGTSFLGNAELDVRLIFSSRVNFEGDEVHVGTITCEPSVVTEGSIACTPASSSELATSSDPASTNLGFDRAALRRAVTSGFAWWQVGDLRAYFAGSGPR